MKSRDFCYWLQGFFELTTDIQITSEQNQKIRNHLAMVFKHEIDPSNGSVEHNKELAALHHPGHPYKQGELSIMLTKDGLTDSVLNC